MKTKTFILLVFLFHCNFMAAQIYPDSQKVILNVSGYQGNLSYRTGAPNFEKYHYFYVTKPHKDTTIYLEDIGGFYWLDNGAYAGESAISFEKDSDGTFKFTGNQHAAILVNFDDSGKIVPIITLNTVKVRIDKRDLTQPYWFSAFTFTIGDKTGTVKRFLNTDTTVVLIKGLQYRISCTPGEPPNICMKYNCGDIEPLDNADNEFSIHIDPLGNVTSSNSFAATGGNKCITFQTEQVRIPPSFFKIAKYGRIRLPFANDPYYFINENGNKKDIKVFRNLVNYIYYIPNESNTEKKFIYREL